MLLIKLIREEFSGMKQRHHACVLLFAACYFKGCTLHNIEQHEYMLTDHTQVLFLFLHKRITVSVLTVKLCILLVAERFTKLPRIFNKQTCIGWRCVELCHAFQFLQNFLTILWTSCHILYIIWKLKIIAWIIY